MSSPALLSLLPAGQSAIIASMAVGSPCLTRLRELGLTPGTRVKVIRRAPLGEPIEISVRGSRLAMRNLEAEGIVITEA